MPSIDPLQILVVRHPLDRGQVVFEDAALNALQGGREFGSYQASGADLGVQILQFESEPSTTVKETFEAACHTLLVVLADSELCGDSELGLWNWIGNAWQFCRSSRGNHGVLILATEERTVSRILALSSALMTLQIEPAYRLGDPAVRPAMFALLLLHRCRALLSSVETQANESAGGPSLLRLFISHAKTDGLPLAQALKHQIEAISWLKGFYDADDLPPGCDWQLELERGVRNSITVILRTNEYDGRPWCQQEVRWADEYATPAVQVDARTQLFYAPSILPLDRVPVVRIPDGNLLRILFAALREDLRFLLFVQRVAEMRRTGLLPANGHYKIFSSSPGMAALLRACRSLALEIDHEPSFILYPDPPLPRGDYEAAQALIQVECPRAKLLTPQTVAATSGGGA